MRKAIARIVILSLAATLASRDAVTAQTAEESLRRLGAENARRYIHPVTAGLGAALNSGFFHTAAVHEPLGFDISVRAMGAFVPSAHDSFVPVLPSSITFEGETFEDPFRPADGLLLSPTAVGEGEGMLAVPQGEFREALLRAGEDPEDFNLRLPDGLALPAVPFALAQVSLGIPLGTEVAVRFTPSIDLGEDVGNVSLLGFGGKHSLDQWLPFRSPFAISVSAGWQRLEAGDYLEATTWQASFVFGGDVSILSLYGAVGVEDTSAEVDYLIENAAGHPALPPEGTRITFRDEGENSVRGTSGLTFNFGVLKLNGEYSTSRYNVVSAKLLIAWR